MRYVAAYMLAILGGKDDPTADDIRPIIESVGIEVEEDKLTLLLEKLRGKNIEEVQESGMLSSEPRSEKTGLRGSDQVRHKPDCEVTEDG